MIKILAFFGNEVVRLPPKREKKSLNEKCQWTLKWEGSFGYINTYIIMDIKLSDKKNSNCCKWIIFVEWNI